MINVIKKGTNSGKYIKKSHDLNSGAYINQKEGWTLFLLNDSTVFSHRINDYNCGELSEKLHTHDYYELTLIASEGNVEYIAEKETLFLHGGMAVLTKPNHFHMFRLPTQLKYERYVIYFKDPERLFFDQNIIKFSSLGNNAYAIFNFCKTDILKIAKEISDTLYSQESDCSKAEAYLSLGRIFLKLCDHNAENKIFDSEITIPKFIREIKTYIDINYNSIESIDTLASRFFYSREYISRSFRKYYNTPLSQYIMNKKLLLCQALLTSGESVENAAKQAGFSNMSSFVKIFKKHNGTIPSKYRADRIR